MSLKVKYVDVPQGAQEAAQVEGQGQPFSIPAVVATGAQDVAYATLEPKGWLLDGSRRLLPSAPEGFWWSEKCSNDTGAFEEPPVITFSFPTPYTATGLSFTFWTSTDEWCSKIRVSWLNGNTLLAQTTAYPNSPRWTLQLTVEGFDRVRVELLATNIPGHFAKVQLIEIGQTLWFGKQEITSVHLVNEIDPTLSELTVDTMTIGVKNKSGVSLVPQENQKMELYRNDKLLAVQYITESSREAKQHYTFSCQSAIGLLEDDYLGGIYNAVPATEVIDDILDGVEYELNAIFAQVTITGYLPVCTRREALQQVVFALGAIATTQGGRGIKIAPVSQITSNTFSKSQFFQGGKVETAPRVARVEVVSHRYTESEEEEILLNEEWLSGEDVLLTFDAPHHSYAMSGGILTGSGANWVTVTANGPVTLTAKKYIHSTQRHMKRNSLATAQERNNVQAVESVTLIHAGNVNEVLGRLYEIAQLRQTLSQEAIITEQRAGQKVTAVNAWGKQIRGYITSMESDLTATGHTAAVKILGVETTAENAVFYAGEFYAGEEALY